MPVLTSHPQSLTTNTMHDQEKQPHTNDVINLSPEIYDSRTQTPNEAEPAYPPQDGGKGAWMFLFGACIIEITAWGTYDSTHTHAIP